MAVYGEDRRNDYAQAIEKTELCALDRQEVVGLMRDVSGFQNFLNKLMGQRVIYTQKRLESLLYKDAKTRVAEYVMEQASKNGRKSLDGAITLRNYLTHQEIANFTGTSRQTVTTVLNQFREANLMDFDRKRIIVRDIDGLKREVKSNV